MTKRPGRPKFRYAQGVDPYAQPTTERTPAMQVITVSDDGTVRIELTADEAKAIRDDLANSRSRSPQSGEFTRYVDHIFGERPAPTFPGGGF